MRYKYLFILLLALFLLPVTACSRKPSELTYEELAAFPTSFSDVLYASDTAVVARKSAAGFEIITDTDGVEYLCCTLEISEVLRGSGKLTELTVREPYDADHSRLGGLKDDTPYLILTVELDGDHVIYSDFCITELDADGAITDTYDTCPWFSIDDVRHTFSDELHGVEDMLTAQTMIGLKKMMSVYSTEYGDAYREHMTYEIWSVDHHISLGMSEDEVYEGFIRTNRSITEDTRELLNKNCVLILCNANNYSLGEMACNMIYDLKANILYR